MKPFMDADFLLSTDTARHLYHAYAEPMPIVDYHCHLSPRDIYEDRRYDNITQLWLGEDHYKWRQMRSCGVEENYITGDASDREKFQKWAETLELAIGNPLYHWSHLELQRYFGYTGVLSGETAQEVWELTEKVLTTGGLSARKCIEDAHVALLCTTDDPTDSLEWHKKLREDDSFATAVLPAWRPDRAIYIEKPDFPDYIARLETVSGIRIDSFSALLDALRLRMDFFGEQGCSVSDHGLPYVMYVPGKPAEIEAVFAKRLGGDPLSPEEADRYKTALLLALGREYARRGWVMQIHFGVLRDVNRRVFRALGPDAGIDCIGSCTPAAQLAGFLNAMAETDQLPKTILYGLNPSDNAVIGTVMGCFQDASAIGKVQHGSAWWFNDNKAGIESQLISLGNLGLLGNFVGMLTDSRSFLSYTRHEYFRRVLCNLVGSWVENGEYPNNQKSLEKIIKGISYRNAVRYFGFSQRLSEAFRGR